MALSSASVNDRISADDNWRFEWFDERKWKLFLSNDAKYFLSSINNNSISDENLNETIKIRFSSNQILLLFLFQI